MIPAPPAGWKQRFSAHLVIYEAPRPQGRIRCYQHLPLEPVSRIVARVAAGAIVETGERLVSREGEFAALCRTTDGRAIGILFGDAGALAIVGGAEHAGHVRELLLRWRLELGVRQRRVRYVPPAGWTAMPTALTTTWFPPAFPDDHAELVVYPAAPTAASSTDELARLLATERATTVGDIHELPITTAAGLTGTRATMTIDAPAGHVHRELVLLWRPPYRYAAKLEWLGPPRYSDVFEAVVSSIEPLPLRSPGDDAAIASHWSD